MTYHYTINYVLCNLDKFSYNNYCELCTYTYYYTYKYYSYITIWLYINRSMILYINRYNINRNHQ